jgi:hypothetical protein
MQAFDPAISASHDAEIFEDPGRYRFSCAKGGTLRNNVRYQAVNVQVLLRSMVKLTSWEL